MYLFQTNFQIKELFFRRKGQAGNFIFKLDETKAQKNSHSLARCYKYLKKVIQRNVIRYVKEVNPFLKILFRRVEKNRRNDIYQQLNSVRTIEGWGAGRRVGEVRGKGRVRKNIPKNGEFRERIIFR